VKTLTATADRLRQRRDAELRWVLALTLYRDRFGASPTSTTYYLSDRPRAKVVGGSGVLGQDWLPLVRDWGALARGLEALRPGATPATLDLVLTNTAPIGGVGRFTSLLRQGLNTSGADLAFGDAVLSVVFVEGSTEETITIGQLVVDDMTSVSEETVTLRCNGRETLMDLQVVAADYSAPSATVPFWVKELAYDDNDPPSETTPADVLVVCKSETAWSGGSHVLPVVETWVLIHRNRTTHSGATMRIHMRSGNGSGSVANTMGVYAVTLPSQDVADLDAITWATKPALGALLGSVVCTFNSDPGSPFDFNLDVAVGATAEDFALAFATPAWATNPNANACRFDPANDSPPVLNVDFV
jgi:hypothetical protein